MLKVAVSDVIIVDSPLNLWVVFQLFSLNPVITKSLPTRQFDRVTLTIQLGQLSGRCRAFFERYGRQKDVKITLYAYWVNGNIKTLPQILKLVRR